MLRLDYELLPADIDAFKCHVATRPALRRAMTQRYLLLLLCLPVLVMLFAWVMGGFRRLQPDTGALLTALLPSLLGLCLLPFFGRMRRASARSSTAFQLAGRASTVMTGPMTMAILPDGIEVTATGARSLYFWSAIDGVEQTPEHVFILIGPQYANIVPKRCLDAASVAALLTAITDAIARRDQEGMEAVEASRPIRRETTP
ncbi:YcxB family protein [Roseomonas terrae]|uniref:YcxB family protein n=1 Tax=Neoroseomonas terrae TaxID=424799 RepID=A0ABS5EM85_9PROT|nr:YcxB family protein [Neoroseomonas terrae]MBR0652140.1 YcxB family protein [Neoroseomonas terrae]